MIQSIKYILTIASIERTLLYRTAKFLVLAGIGVVVIIFFLVASTIVPILDDNGPGEFLLEGTDVHLALYIFSYLQAILIIFVAGDFRKAEEKNRLDQVMLSRPMTTANWVLGKYFGVVSALMYLNLFLLFLAGTGRVIKIIFTGAGFNILPFIKYFAIATLPSIIFIIAFVFFLVSLLRSQALAIILSLGYVSAIWFYFHHKFHGLLDYGCFFAPLFWSDLVGFGDIQTILWQRLFYIVLAFSLLGFSILLYPRLRQSVWSQRISQVCAVAFLLLAAGVGYSIIHNQKALQQEREYDFTFQKEWLAEPICKVAHYDFNIKFGEKKNAPLQVLVKLALSNPNPQSLEQLIFALNSALRVSQVFRQDGSPIEFTQEHQLLRLDLVSQVLQPTSTDTIQISYAGSIDADKFMLDRLPDEKGIIDKSNGPWIQGNMSAWLSQDFAVLPAQCGWYPVPGAAAGYQFSSPRPKYFATANFQIQTAKELSVVTQGEKSERRLEGSKAIHHFKVRTPVPGFSLNIGPYNRLAHQFSQTEIEIYFHDKHLLDYDIFADVADTCYEAVETILGIFEDVTGVAYPYKKLALVEVPLQMQVYANRHGLNNVLVQPGIIMIDEVTLASRRLKKEVEDKTKRAKRRGRDDSPKRIKRDVFIDNVLDIFLSGSVWRRDGSLTSPIKNYLHFQLDITDPVLDRALELQFFESSERQIRDLFYPDRWNTALSSYDRMRQNEWNWAVRRRYGIEIDTVITALNKFPLAEIRPENEGKLYRACVDFKAPPILQMLSERIGAKNYKKALQQLSRDFLYKKVDREIMLDVVRSFSQENVDDYFKQWFDLATFPGYRITLAKAEKYDTGKMNIVYKVSTRVQNGEKGEGFVRLVCATKNDKIRRNLKLGSYEEKEVHFVVSEEPKDIEVIPYFSRNRGRIKKQISIANRILRKTPSDTTFTVSSTIDSLSFVIDDQDEGFFTPVSTEAQYLRPPSKGKTWWARTNPYAFGKYYFGWRMKRAGSGAYPARWETVVPRGGEYELSFYFRADKSWIRRRLSRIFKIEVTSAEGTFPIEFKPEATADGWYPLGRFQFVKNENAVVELADTGSGYLVADAIRWEFVE